MTQIEYFVSGKLGKTNFKTRQGDANITTARKNILK
jgi:hypothetical protein